MHIFTNVISKTNTKARLIVIVYDNNSTFNNLLHAKER